MRIGVSSFCYERLTTAGEMTLKDTIANAKEQGFDVIELLDLGIHDSFQVSVVCFNCVEHIYIYIYIYTYIQINK